MSAVCCLFEKSSFRWLDVPAVSACSHAIRKYVFIYYFSFFFIQVSGSKLWQTERSCMCCQESGEREATVSLLCPKAAPGEPRLRRVCSGSRSSRRKKIPLAFYIHKKKEKRADLGFLYIHLF